MLIENYKKKKIETTQKSKYYTFNIPYSCWFDLNSSQETVYIW